MIKFLNKIFDKELVFYYVERTEKEYEYRAKIIGFDIDLEKVYFMCATNSENAYKNLRTLNDYLAGTTIILHDQKDLNIKVYSAHVKDIVAVSGVHAEFKKLQKKLFDKNRRRLLKEKKYLLDQIERIDLFIEDIDSRIEMRELYENYERK